MQIDCEIDLESELKNNAESSTKTVTWRVKYRQFNTQSHQSLSHQLHKRAFVKYRATKEQIDDIMFHHLREKRHGNEI